MYCRLVEARFVKILIKTLLTLALEKMLIQTPCNKFQTINLNIKVLMLLFPLNNNI